MADQPQTCRADHARAWHHRPHRAQATESDPAGEEGCARRGPAGRDFTASAPGTKLVGDITYIPTGEGWLYLATWLDLATREIVGYSMTDHHRASLVVEALHMAAGRSD
ncbi:DDE-type integrase/transposase/recombinase [Streptomyces sp. NPDC017943]|uniref:DDE-type integrase/transposase/recombinase n=1 Tax=Streptomyces sp. NPDC017943 TaxID=3365019 RepID=UPI0037A5788E